jgi:hypothetical protein
MTTTTEGWKITPEERRVLSQINNSPTERHKALIDYLRSDKPITLSLRLFYADVLEELAFPRRGPPKKSTQKKYEDIARKKNDVAAVCANHIVSVWRSESACGNWAQPGADGRRRPIKQAAVAEAIEYLQSEYPKKYRIGFDAADVARILDRMPALRNFKFRRLFNVLESKKK